MQRILSLSVVFVSATTLLSPVLCVGETPCVGGFAGSYPCSGIDLLANLPLSSIGGGSGNDIWGWTDADTGKEYALVGRSNGTAFVDISDPENPVYVGNLPTQTSNSSWRDIKVHANHAYIVADSAGNHGMQVFDLTQLRNVTNQPVTFSNTAHYSGFGSAHNIAINEDTGFAYVVDSGTCSNGLHMVNIQNPTQPLFAGCHSADGAIHDAQCVTYHGPDTEHQGKEICFTATLTSDTMDIVDVTSKSATVTLSKNGYVGALTPHQGWLTEDHRFLLFGDESDETSFGHNTRTYIFNVSDLDNPFLAGAYTGPLPAIDHNQYVRDDFTYQANYTIGLRVLGLDDVANGNLTEVAFFDTRPENDDKVFQGAWSVYPFFNSCSVIVSDIQRGLFVLRPSTRCACGDTVREGTEQCDGSDLGGSSCSDFGCTGGGTLTCSPVCTFDLSGCSDCPSCDFDGVCETGEDCSTCPSDCISGATDPATCGNGICEAGDGEDCLSCPEDCNGQQKGNPNTFFCCGDGDGLNPVGCTDSRCISRGRSCTDQPAQPISYCCGDLVCAGNETSNNCAIDCGTGCAAGQPGDPCTFDSNCCSGKCKGKPGSKTCR